MDVSDEDPVRCRGNVTCSGNQFLCRVSLYQSSLQLFFIQLEILDLGWRHVPTLV